MGRDRGPVHCRGSVRSAGAWVGRVVSLGPKSSALSAVVYAVTASVKLVMPLKQHNHIGLQDGIVEFNVPLDTL